MNMRQISDDFFTIGDVAILQKMIGNHGPVPVGRRQAEGAIPDRRRGPNS